MTAASATTHASEEASKTKPKHVQDPEHYRMSIGDHLEELRWRMIFGLILVLMMIFRPQGILGRDTLNVRRWFRTRQATEA